MYAILFERKVGHYMAYIREKWKKGKPYYYIVESQRDGTKVRQRILEYIGTVDNLKEYALKGYKSIQASQELASHGAEAQYAEKELTFKCYEHGACMAMLWTARQIGIEKILDETFPQKTIKGMKRSTALLLSMIHRAIEPGSKREFSSWANGTSLPYHMKFHAEDLSSQAFWEAMDGISQEQISAAWEKVMERLLDLCGIDIPCFHLDYSNYFTYIDSKNNRCLICKRGHNKQKRDDLKQFSLAVLTAAELTVPLLWEIYPGNRNDTEEFAAFTSHVREGLGKLCGDPSDVTIVFDGGSNSRENLQSLGMHFICAHSLSGLKDLYGIDIADYETVTLDSGAEKKMFRIDGLEFSGMTGTGILTYSPALEDGQRAQMEKDLLLAAETMSSLQEKLGNKRSGLYRELKRKERETRNAAREAEEYNQKIDADEEKANAEGRRRRGRKKKHLDVPEWDEKNALEEIVRSHLYKKKAYLKEFTKLTLEKRSDGCYKATWKEDAVKKAGYCRKFYGKKLTVTDHKDWTSKEILEEYSRQECIENGIFRVSKDIDHFSVRPQHHWTDDKIRVHVFICLTAIVIAEIMRKHFEENGHYLTKGALLDRLGEVHDVWVFIGKKKAERVIEKADTFHQELWECAVKLKQGLFRERNKIID